MEKLIELLKQIEELAGVGIHALQGATHPGGGEGGQPGHGGPGGPPQHGGPPHEGGGFHPGGKPPEGSPAEERGESDQEAAREGDKPRY